MNTKLMRLKYFKYDGDPVKANLALSNEDGIKADFNNKDLIVRMTDDDTKFIRVKPGLYVVGVVSPMTMGYVYYRMSEPQIKQLMEIADRGENLVLD